MSYLEDFEKTLAEKCHQNEPPFCQAACPFRLDIKGVGKPEQAIDYLAQHKVNQLYCCLPSALSEQIVPVINYCENNLIHFYSCLLYTSRCV